MKDFHVMRFCCLFTALLAAVNVSRAQDVASLQAELDALLSTNRAPLAVWDVTGRLEAGFGYRDNLLMTTVAPESSPFISSAGDFSAIRISETGSEWVNFLLAEDLRYLDAKSVDGETLISATSRFSKPINPRNTLGAELFYLYQNQVLDVSETELDLRRVLVEGHGVSLRPDWKHDFSEDWFLRLEASAQRQFYQGELDDLWEVGAKAGIARKLGRASEASLSFRTEHWIYDTREQTDQSGVPVAGTHLYYWRPEVLGEWRQRWGQEGRWRTHTKLAWLWNADNGSGYFDYDRLTLGQRIRWVHPKWEVSAGVRCGWYFYSVQQTESDYRERFYLIVEGRVERRLAKHWLVFADAQREWNRSNEPLDEYRDWQCRGGLVVEF